MFNFLLDKTTADKIPDGYASGMEFHSTEFFIGIIVGLVIAFFLWAIISAIKSNIINCNKESNEDEKSE